MAKKDKKHKHGEGNGVFRPNGTMCANAKANGSTSEQTNGSANGKGNGSMAALRLGKDCDYERELRRLPRWDW